MNERLAKKLLSKSGFTPMQADALSSLLAETATKQDIEECERSLSLKLDGLETRLRAEIVRATSEVRADLSQSIAQTHADLAESIGRTRSDLTQASADAQTKMMRWGMGMIFAMSSIFTLLGIFID